MTHMLHHHPIQMKFKQQAQVNAKSKPQPTKMLIFPDIVASICLGSPQDLKEIGIRNK